MELPPLHAAFISHRDMAASRLQWLSAAAIFLLLAILPVNPSITLSSLLPGAAGHGIRALDLSLPPLLSMAAVALWVLGHRFDPARQPLSLGPPLLAAPLLALVALSLATIPFAVNREHSLFMSTYHILLLALYLVAVNSSWSRWLLVAALALGSVLQAAVGWPQFLLGHSIGLQALGESNLDAAWPGVSIVMMGESRLLRAYGLTGHPNLLGGYLAFSIPLIAGFLLHLQENRWRLSLPLSIAILVALSALLVTFSRAAWLGLAVGGAGMLLLLRSRGDIAPPLSTHTRLLLAIAALVVAGFVAANWQVLLGRFGAEGHATEIRSVEERLALNAVAWSLVLERPLTGVGLGNYVEGVFRLLPERYPEFPGMTVHNLALLAATELGVLGGLLWIFLMLVPWVALWRARGRLALTPWYVGLYGALAALAVVSMFDYYLWGTLRIGVLQWLAWGLWARDWNEHCTSRGFETRSLG
jgi:hypothetical protein